MAESMAPRGGAGGHGAGMLRGLHSGNSDTGRDRAQVSAPGIGQLSPGAGNGWLP